MSAEYKKMLEDVMGQVANLSKAVNEKAAATAADKAKMEEAVSAAVEKGMEARKAEFLQQVRKGSYSTAPKQETVQSEVMLRKASNDREAEFQKWNDDVVLLSSLLRTDPRNLKSFQKRSGGVSDLKKAMDTLTTNEGTEWVPTDFSADLYDRVRLATKVAGLFTRINMPTDIYKLPVVKSDAVAYRMPEATADGTDDKITASTPGTRNATLNAEKLACRVLFSEELNEDSIIPILEFTKNNMALAMAAAQETAIINGDTAADHMDADVTSTLDARTAWDGLRKMAVDSNQVDLGTFSLTNLRAMRGKMGKYGANPTDLAWVVSAKGYIKMLGLDEVSTLEKYGPNATVLKGELGKLDGIPIIVSEYLRDDLNAVGIDDLTTNTKGEVLLVYVPGFVLGDRRKVTVRTRFDEERDQQIVVSTWRGDFQPIYDYTTEFIVVEGTNVAV